MTNPLANVNLDVVGAGAVSFVLGIAAVSTFLHKYLPATKKTIGIAAEAISFANELIKAAEDDKVTEEEWNVLKSRIETFKGMLKK